MINRVKVRFNELEVERKIKRDSEIFLYELMMAIQRNAKRLVPVDTGLLRSSIVVEPKNPASVMKVVAGTSYACVYGSQAHINCGKGKGKVISAIKVGDKVLAQDGLLHKVVGVSKFSVLKKPNLVELEYEYRKDMSHKIVLTQDHKVLSKKNGCLVWVEAGVLKKNSVVFSPIKKSYNKGFEFVERFESNCLMCGKKVRTLLSEKIKYNRGAFCSQTCQLKFYDGEGNPNFGDKYSVVIKKKLSEKRKLFHKLNPEKHVNRILAKKGFMTSIEKQVFNWLNNSGLKFEKQKKIGNKFVDFYVNDLNLIIECDGAFWHKNQNKDIARDTYLLKKIKDGIIIHLHFCDYRWSKDIVKNPLKNVYYIKCNPFFNSFVNPDVFKEIKVLNVKKFVCDKNDRTFLYDLSVEGMHSFVASGLLISNSHVEFGTSRQKPQPYMRPALDKVVHVDSKVINKRLGTNFKVELG